jgi:hypothetical protein
MTIRVFAVVNMQLRAHGYVGDVNRGCLLRKPQKIILLKKLIQKHLTKRIMCDII